MLEEHNTIICVSFLWWMIVSLGLMFEEKERKEKRRGCYLLPVLYAVDVLLRPGRSNDVQTDGGSTVGSHLHSSPRPWPLTLAPDWTRAPLWTRPLLSWMPGHKSSPGGVSHCWVSAVSRRPGCGSGWDWALRYQWPGKGRKLDKVFELAAPESLCLINGLGWHRIKTGNFNQ